MVGKESVIALDDVSLEIKKGEIVCIFGTSGSGKSTFLNMLAGLEKPTSGRIIIDNKLISDMKEEELARFRQKNVGFIFQSYNLIASLNALENVALPLTFRGVNPSKREEQSKKILKDVGLYKYRMHKPSQMSGGQQQRVGIARAFVGKPKIIFADEPTGNLDSKTSDSVMDTILNIARDNNQTLVIVTHDPHIAKYADTIVHFIDGKIDKIKYKHEEIENEDKKMESN
jgi:putative ABC transport system ATP-binding protein